MLCAGLLITRSILYTKLHTHFVSVLTHVARFFRLWSRGKYHHAIRTVRRPHVFKRSYGYRLFPPIQKSTRSSYRSTVPSMVFYRCYCKPDALLCVHCRYSTQKRDRKGCIDRFPFWASLGFISTKFLGMCTYE